MRMAGSGPGEIDRQLRCLAFGVCRPAKLASDRTPDRFDSTAVPDDCCVAKSVRFVARQRAVTY